MHRMNSNLTPPDTLYFVTDAQSRFMVIRYDALFWSVAEATGATFPAALLSQRTGGQGT